MYKLNIIEKFLYFTVLYNAAILQSGSQLYAGRSNDARVEAFKTGPVLDRRFNSSDSRELLKVLQNASSTDIMKVSEPNLDKLNELQKTLKC